MTTYRNGFTYRTDLAYKGNDGVFQKPVLSRAIAIAANDAQAQNPAIETAWVGIERTDFELETGWQFAQAQNQNNMMPWGKPFALSQEAELAHSEAIAMSFDTETAWAKPLPANTEAISTWGEAIALPEIIYSLHWSKTYRADAEKNTGWLTITHRYEGEFYRNKEDYRSFWKYRLINRPLALDNSLSTGWGGYTAKLNDNNIPWGDGFHVWGTETPLEWTSDPTPLPDQPAPPEPEIEDFYNMATDLTVIDVATQTALAIDDVSMSLDIDSFAWTLSARVLNRASMNLAMPSKLIKVSTMGYDWIFVVESYSSTRGIGTTYRIQASSQSRMLDAPWQDISSNVEAAATTWKQAAESLMPLGWSVEFNRIQDYIIPAGAWSYIDKTLKAALADLLEAIGVVAIPDMSQQVLHIQPRYKYAPWEYNAASTEPDVIVHEAMIISESGQYHPANVHNGVWVSGNSRHGVIVEAVREGTDGLPAAADVYHDLIVDVDAGRQKAKQIIAASGSKTLVTLETIITDEQASPGLITPGMLVEIRSDGETWRGICLSTNVAGAGLPAITQTITVERDHGDHS